MGRPAARTYEAQLLRVVRRLPPERVSQVVDFARFLEVQTVQVTSAMQQINEERGGDARWDSLLATDESQQMLERMADAALLDIQAGHAKPMVFRHDGEIAPG